MTTEPKSLAERCREYKTRVKSIDGPWVGNIYTCAEMLAFLTDVLAFISQHNQEYANWEQSLKDYRNRVAELSEDIDQDAAERREKFMIQEQIRKAIQHDEELTHIKLDKLTAEASRSADPERVATIATMAASMLPSLLATSQWNTTEEAHRMTIDAAMQLYDEVKRRCEDR